MGTKEILGRRWIVSGRAGAALILLGLELTARHGAADARLLALAAGGAALAALLTPMARNAGTAACLFLLDLVWIAAGVLGAGTYEGLTLFFPVVALAAGFQVGGWGAALIGLAAAVSLAATRILAAPAPPSLVAVGLQGALVLLMGGVADRAQSHLRSRDRALAVAAQALERMRLDTDTIVANLPSAVVSLDREGVIVHCNQVAERILGLSAALVRGRRAVEVFPEGTQPVLRLLVDGLEQGTAYKRLDCEVRMDGRPVPLGLGTAILRGPGGETSGVVGVFQDLTDVRRQEALARRRERLAAVGELAAGIAHEIRNSVLPASGSVQILGQELTLTAEQGRLFEVIEREMDNVERFVGDLLCYTRDQALRPDRVDLAELARETAEEMACLADPPLPVEVVGPPTWAWGDREQLRQAVRNLVRNAVEAGKGQGRVALRTGITAEGRPWVEVDDDGPGLPEEMSRIVQPFFTTKPGGTGLGLSIVHRIVEDHEGRLEPGVSRLGGACLRLTLSSAVGKEALASVA